MTDTKTDAAHLVAGVPCKDEACARTFLSDLAMMEHAEAVHTFDDIEQMVREAVREAYYKPGDYNASPPVDSVWVWVRDFSTDWCVFEYENGGDSDLFKVSYSIVDNEVTLGTPIEVTRRTVYEPVPDGDVLTPNTSSTSTLGS